MEVMDLVLEWQRLRKMEKALIEFKSMVFAPCITQMSNGLSLVHYHTDHEGKRNIIMTDLLLNIRSPFMPDTENMAKLRKGEEE
jgi:hypothetical protein